MLKNLRSRISSNQTLQKAKTIVTLDAKGLSLTTSKQIRKLFLRAKNSAALKAPNVQRGLETFDKSSDSSSSNEALISLSYTRPSEIVESSVIIPVFNKADLTFRCLRALTKELERTKVEIIVVDNGSTDETEPGLTSLGDKIRYIRNDSNLGFVEACNIGAKQALGEFLIFLNNDTLVQPEWYEAMITAVSADPQVGAVGSMLIFPDGTIQEAGAIIWSDASCYSYGRGEDPTDDRFNFLREVDYCSAASLLIRRSLFEEIGGFDMRYAPAYYEDTDLCMSVRSKGYKVVYQPGSKVVHFEGATAGKSTASGFKRFQEINRSKFVEKWQATLSTHHSPDESNAVDLSNRKIGPNILVFCDVVPRPKEAAGFVRLLAILRFLTRMGPVRLVHLVPEADDLIKRPLADLGVELVWMPTFREVFKKGRCDIAVLCYPLVANITFGKVRRWFPDAKIIFDTIDLHYIRYRREFELTGDPELDSLSRQFEKIERKIAQNADQVWCITNEEKEELLRIVPTAKIRVIPIIQKVHGPGEVFSDRTNLLFIGSFAHRPNRDGIEHFLRDIFPLILEEDQSIKLHIIGSNMPESVHSLATENVIVHGFVEDPTKLFQSSRVFVSPLRFGAGMKGKIGHAMAYGLPVVTTSIGAEGFNLKPGVDAIIADRADDFAKGVLSLYSDESLWNLLANNGRELIQDRYSPTAVFEIIDRSIKSL